MKVRGSKREEKPKPGIVLFRLPPFTEAERVLLRGRFPDLQVVAFRSLPIPYGTVALIAKDSLLTVAGPCGIYTRFPLHLLSIFSKTSK
jgi:hypothetical protein